jgi:7,8-dihydropterin-6-yl-methyl-4-(beta-D-ribofuranosyl)aminobenzene 5'-phosphate synthase
MDHTGSLYPLIDKMPRPVTLAVHPEAFRFPRYRGLDNGSRLRFPRTLIKSDLEDREVEILETKRPTLILDDMIMITGEVERTTGFEMGLPNALMERQGEIVEDPILDDQSLAIHLKGKGLVVISGCSHSGIINTVLFSNKMTGVQKTYAVLGGFHLTGSFFESIIEVTIEEMKKMAPKVLVPMHCTGWKAVQRFSEAFPSAFILNSVGSKITL